MYPVFGSYAISYIVVLLSLLVLKSIKERKLMDSIKKKHGKEISNHWNNSAITPGTEYMKKLNRKII